VPFNLNCSPFARIRDLSQALRPLLHKRGSHLRIKEVEFAQSKIKPDIDTTLYQLGISESVRVYVSGTTARARLTGGGGAGLHTSESTMESWGMGLAAGGRIKQTIEKDPNPRAWNKAGMKMVNIQMVNSVAFEAITGLVPPMPTISFEDYTKAKIPYYIHDRADPSWICQQFSTVSEMDTAKAVKFC